MLPSSNDEISNDHHRWDVKEQDHRYRHKISSLKRPILLGLRQNLELLVLYPEGLPKNTTLSLMRYP